MRRLVDVARLQAVNWPTVVGWPWGILVTSWIINIGIFGAMNSQDVDSGGTTGGVMSIYIVVVVAYVQAITQLLPFALTMGLSRRTYYAGIWLFAAAEAVVNGTLLYLLSVLERVTGGWGVDLSFFRIMTRLAPESNPLLQWLIFTVPFLFATAAGVALGVLMKRWGSNGILSASVALIVTGGGFAVLATYYGWWRGIGGWFADQPAVALFAGYPALLAVACAGLAFVGLRRTTP